MTNLTNHKITIGKDAEIKGLEFAIEKYNISRETARRYRRAYRQTAELTETDDTKRPNLKLLEKIGKLYSPKELMALASGGLHEQIEADSEYDFNGKEFTFGVMTDTHIGSKYTDVGRIYAAFEEFENAGVDLVFHCGDVFEGMSNRPGHVYELTEIGYDAQLEKGKEIFSHFTHCPIHIVDGNHDRWFMKSSGGAIVKSLCESQENLIYGGHDWGDIIVNGAAVRLWHGEDFSSYAHSYRIQKVIESFTGGDKPNILLAGHVHKACYIFERHVHCVSAGSMQSQSGWMKSKRLPSHTGFWIIRCTIDEGHIQKFNSEFYPFYE